jgi:hypothetical protein
LEAAALPVAAAALLLAALAPVPVVVPPVAVALVEAAVELAEPAPPVAWQTSAGIVAGVNVWLLAATAEEQISLVACPTSAEIHVVSERFWYRYSKVREG